MSFWHESSRFLAREFPFFGTRVPVFWHNCSRKVVPQPLAKKQVVARKIP
jgi:hypothetical protein